MNGLSSIVAKNLSPHGSATTHLMSFQPSPTVLDASGKVPVLLRFEGPLYLDGPTWRMALTGPTWRD
jgi:hypothetical protein